MLYLYFFQQLICHFFRGGIYVFSFMFALFFSIPFFLFFVHFFLFFGFGLPISKHELRTLYANLLSTNPILTQSNKYTASIHLQNTPQLTHSHIPLKKSTFLILFSHIFSRFLSLHRNKLEAIYTPDRCLTRTFNIHFK